jgi:hypothetical protein
MILVYVRGVAAPVRSQRDHPDGEDDSANASECGRRETLHHASKRKDHCPADQGS